MIDQGSQSLRELIRILVRNLGMLEKGGAACCSITLTQCHAIVEIGRREKISLTDLADLLCVDKSTMSRTTDSLVKAGIAVREVDSGNRRYVVIQLTQDGQSIFRSIENSMKNYFQCILEAIPEDQRGQVFESLALLTNAVRNSKHCMARKQKEEEA